MFYGVKPLIPKNLFEFKVESKWRKVMAKGKITKKMTKKKPQKTIKQKRQAKKEKKNQNKEKLINQQYIDEKK